MKTIPLSDRGILEVVSLYQCSVEFMILEECVSMCEKCDFNYYPSVLFSIVGLKSI